MVNLKGQRKEDQSFWAWFDYITTKYKLLVWLGISILAGAGFGLRLPIQTANETKAQINAKIDTAVGNVQREVNELKKEHEAIQPQIAGVKDDLNILLRMGCADKYISTHDKYISGLECKKQ